MKSDGLFPAVDADASFAVVIIQDVKFLSAILIQTDMKTDTIGPKLRLDKENVINFAAPVDLEYRFHKSAAGEVSISV